MGESKGVRVPLSSGEALPPKRVNPNHLDNLRASGISDDTIRMAGIYSETSITKLRLLLNNKRFAAKCGAGLVFPYPGRGIETGYVRIKPDRPQIDSASGKPRKYEAPRERPNEAYFPPGVDERVIEDATIALVLTEGEKKALKADQEGFRAVGLGGIFSWKKKNYELLIPSLERINWKNRLAYICFDSDPKEETRSAVEEAASRFAAVLTSQGANVKIVHLPPGPPDASGTESKMGLDDFLVAHGPAAFAKLLENADDPKPVEGLSLGQKADDMDAKTEAEHLLNSIKADDVHKLRFWKGDFLYFRGSCYAEIPSHELRAEVVKFLNGRKFFGLKTSHVNNVLEQLRAQAILPQSVEPPRWLPGKSRPMLNGEPWPTDSILVAKNGIVHLPSFIEGKPCLHPPTPKFFATSALDFDFDPEASFPKVWRDLLSEYWHGDRECIEVLQEWFGYTITADTSQQKILAIIGPPRSGKGTICRTLTRMFGKGSVAGPTLASFAQNFGMWELLHKPLAIISDARLNNRQSASAVVERLLSISGEDLLSVDRKNREPVTVQLPTRLMICSNELPELRDASTALVRRLIVLRMTKSFLGSEDRTVMKRIEPELPGILIWAIEGWRRLNERGHFRQPGSATELVEQMEDLASPVHAFVRDECRVSPGLRIPCEHLHKAYLAWAEERGVKEGGSSARFGSALRAILPSVSRIRPRSAHGATRTWCYDGINLDDSNCHPDSPDSQGWS